MAYQATPLSNPDILLLQTECFVDERGYLSPFYRQAEFLQQLPAPLDFVQDYVSRSRQGVLRGLHIQTQQPQGKLLHVLEGKIFDVAVDLRPHSTYFGQPTCVVLDAAQPQVLWIPPGFAHGYYVLSDSALLLYKASAYWQPQHERVLRWNDAQLAIPWPLLPAPPILSDKDAAGTTLAELRAEIWID